ncbi:MAG: hypothetical protein M1829_002781 [Trizodia sp. TS-e1964]|nr:MAG: hypothetical protein M1829_002781 [Trizodia sp. TS-e1964]
MPQHRVLIPPSDFVKPGNTQNIPSSTSSTSRSNAELNLCVLQRYNSLITAILSIAPYAVVYLFSPSSSQWEKTGVEGTLFVCKIAEISEDQGERYEVIILNRRGLENFQVQLHNGGDVEITDDYLILRVNNHYEGQMQPNTLQDENQKIYGLWIFSEPPPSSTANTRALNAQIISECASAAESSRKKAALRRAAMAASLHGGNIDAFRSDVRESGTESLPMGRQLSLRELFGQQRKSDSAWSVMNHNPRLA